MDIFQEAKDLTFNAKQALSFQLGTLEGKFDMLN